MRIRVIAAHFFALLVATESALAQPAIAATACPDSPVTVQGAQADETEIACDAARAVFAFFAPLDLRAAAALTVEVSAQLPPGVPQDAVACYVIPSRRVVVLRYEQFSWHRNWFGLAADKRLYRAVIAHELAHAIAACHAGDARLTLAAQEYVAYVAMIATMPEDRRRDLLALHPDGAFDDPRQINEVFYALNPMRFAVESYRHWTRQPDSAGFLRRVLDGGEIQGLAGY